MPASRHGRLGKKGRPRKGDSPFAEIASDTSLHPAMRKLADEAARRGLSRGQLARIAGREPEALMRSFYAAAPRLETLEAIGDGMRLGRRTARSLLGKLTILDELDLKCHALETVTQRAAIFAKPIQLRWDLDSAIASAGAEKRRKSLAAYDVARVGLLSAEELREYGVAPELHALCAALGFGLVAYLVPNQTLAVRRLEAAAALEWLRRTLPASFEGFGTIEAEARAFHIDESVTNYSGLNDALEQARDIFSRAIGPAHLHRNEKRTK
jgi:hypothetical protein